MKEDRDFIHIRKVNILGEPGAGKSSLISHMENKFVYKNELEDSRMSIDSNNPFSLYIEQIKLLKVNHKNKSLELNIYETNINSFETKKLNLEIILVQTECIIIMWDNSRIETFNNIPDLIAIINNMIKNKIIQTVPIFLIKNKIDIKKVQEFPEEEDEKDDFDINSFLEKNNVYKNITYKEISLLDQGQVNQFLDELYTSIKNSTKINLLEPHNQDVRLVELQFIDKKELNFNINNMKKIKIALLGHHNVGKTTFFNHFMNNGKNQEIKPTIGIEGISLKAKINNDEIFINLYDTAGLEKYDSIMKTYYENDGIILFFDVTNYDSYQGLSQLFDNIKNYSHDQCEIMILGNKIDSNDKRVVYKKDSVKFANSKNVKYYECSSLKGLNIYEAFKDMILTVYNAKKDDEKNKNNNQNFQRRNTNASNRSVVIEQKEEKKPSWCC